MIITLKDSEIIDMVCKHLFSKNQYHFDRAHLEAFQKKTFVSDVTIVGIEYNIPHYGGNNPPGFPSPRTGNINLHDAQNILEKTQFKIVLKTP